MLLAASHALIQICPPWTDAQEASCRGTDYEVCQSLGVKCNKGVEENACEHNVFETSAQSAGAAPPDLWKSEVAGSCVLMCPLVRPLMMPQRAGPDDESDASQAGVWRDHRLPEFSLSPADNLLSSSS